MPAPKNKVVVSCLVCAYRHSTGLPLIIDGVLRWTDAVRKMHVKTGCKGNLVVAGEIEPEEVANAS